MEKWEEILEQKIKQNGYVNNIAFLNEYSNIIPGPNREAKNKKIKWRIKKSKEIKTTKEKNILENNMFESNKINLNVRTKSITFGLISDTHFNSKYVQITHLNKFYDICKKEGITDIYHAGDIDDGEQMRPGHVYENYTQGADDHIEEIIKNYPYREGIITHFITGNHDASFRKSCGLDIGNLISAKRPDLDYLGRDIVTVNITDKVSLMLRHPWTGSSYALSYRPQKMIEAMETSYLDKPTILAIGHFHKMEYLFYHGIHCFQTGCFQGATPFTVGKGLSVAMGGWIITVNLNENGELESIIPRAITFNNMIKEDYKNYQ